MSFLIQMSVLSPDSKSKHHPLYNESGIVFECKNCSLTEAISIIREHKEYTAFCRRNLFFNEPYIYYTDSSDNWLYFEDDA